MIKSQNASKFKRIASNSLLLFVRMLAITVINLYAIRLLLRVLGQEDFGTFNAVAGVILTSTFLTSTLAISIQRFYSYALGEGKNDQLSDIFSASINIIIVLSVLLFLLFETAGLWFVNTQMYIPPERIVAANWVFQFSLGTLCLGLLQLPYLSAIFANEEMGIFALISLTECLLRLAVIELIGIVAIDRLIFYSAGLFIVSVLSFLLYAFIAHHRYTECRYHYHVLPGIYQSLLSFSGWTTYSALASVGMTQGITILLYMFFGPIATAAYAIALQVFHAFQTLSNSIVVAFRPAMVKSYAERNFFFLDKMFTANNKFILYLLFLVAIPLILELRTIFSWWLGDVSEEAIAYSRLIIIYTVCLSMHNPITTIIQSTGQVKTYCLCVDSIILMSIPTTWLFFRMGSSSELCVVIMICSCIIAHITRLIILKHLYPQLHYKSYFLQVILSGIIITLLTGVVAGTIHYTLFSDIIRVIAVSTVSITIMLPAIFLIGLSTEEKKMIHNFFVSKLKKQ